jgi:uncharacterized small protein (DUF1192 family)
LAKYSAKEESGVLVISKSMEKLADENVKISDELDYITKEELIEAIHLLAAEISQLKGESFDIKFTYENKKNKL